MSNKDNDNDNGDKGENGVPKEPIRPGGPAAGPGGPGSARPTPPRGFRGPNIRLWWILGVILLLVIVIPSFLTEMLTDWMWFGSHNLEEVYATRLWLAVSVFFIAAILGGIVCAVNWIIAWRVSQPKTIFPGQQAAISKRAVGGITAIASIAVGIFLGVVAAEEWQTILFFLNGTSFGETDPLFGQDVGFYIFGLPFWHFLRGWAFAVLLLATIGSAIIYVVGVLPSINQQMLEMQKARRPANPSDFKLTLDPRIGTHLSVLGAIFLLLIAVGYWLSRFDLLYTTRPVAYGAGYTDANARLPSLYIMMVVAALMAILLLVNLRIRTWKLLVGALGVWLLALVLVGGVYPAIIQEAVVRPNELDQERPFIENNIAGTRKAFGLDKFQEQEVSTVESITAAQVAANANTINNIRLWDYRPLLDTYAQLQEIRQYYTFGDADEVDKVDIDRYNIGGRQRQIMLAAREMSTAELSAQSRTWQNEHFYYTHGYGAVASPVNEIEGEGFPRLWLKDIPPQSSVPELNITRPEIYYGEKTDTYVFVNSDQPEFDYPEGDTNKEVQYQGTGGVAADGFIEKLLFALRFGEGKVLLNDDITPGTRILYNRNINDSVRLLAPFLRYDSDPYLVIVEGKLYWMQDAYTVSDRYPYSTPTQEQDWGRFNYIRNSVKVVIDAYHGTHTFYVSDANDPLVRAYRGIFPALFKDISEMPAGLRAHIRYPEDLMTVQARMYSTFHMTNPNTFYAREDQWAIPTGAQSEGSEPLEAYYVNMQLPGSTGEEFVLVLPFTPVSRDNMIAWMAGRSDGENYGQVQVIRYPKQQQIFGPKQIEARINQDPIISQQLTLWRQGGSSVRLGNLLIIPIANTPVSSTVLYVQPLFLQATSSRFPELRRVIVATGSGVGMGEDLKTAIDVALKIRPPIIVEGTPDPPPVGTPVPGTTPSPGGATPTPFAFPTPVAGSAPDLTQSALRHYETAQTALRAGDWATYGREIDSMKADLDALALLVGIPTFPPLPSPEASPSP